jgi:hypothetical protein
MVGEMRTCECGCGERFRALRGQRFVDATHEAKSAADLMVPSQGEDDFWDDDRGWNTWPGNNP